MIYKDLGDLGQATLEVAQGAVLPILGVCLVVSVLFFVFQLIFSFQDLNMQFLLRLALLLGICVFMAKGVSEKFIAYTKSVYESVPSMVR
jgi:flagellar biosynthesis protein FliQ